MALLTRDQLLAKEELKIEKVELGEDHVFVMEMSARRKEEWEMSMMTPIKDDDGKVTDYERSLEDFRAKLAVRTVCDGLGVLIFGPEDYPTLSENMGARRMDIIATRSQKLNKITDEDKENMLKNSEGDQDADSNSGSANS